MKASHLRLVDTDTGEIVHTTDPAEEIKALQAALVRAERTIAGLRADKERKRKEHARREDVTDIFDEWRLETNHRRSKLTDDRFDAIASLLDKGYTREHFSEVIAGLKAAPRVLYGRRGLAGDRKDDIEWVCAKGARFEAAAVIGRKVRQEVAL